MLSPSEIASPGVKNILLITIGILILSFTLTGQTIDTPTETEKKAAHVLAGEFEIKLDDAGSIEPVVKEMFPADHTRVSLDEARRMTANSNMVLVPGLELKAKLLNDVSEDEWRQFYVATFDIMQYPMNRMMNRMIEAARKGKNGDDMMDGLKPSDLYPADVNALLDKDPILRNFVLKKGVGQPISTVEELRRVNAVLGEALTILRNKYAGQAKLTPDARKFIQHFSEGDEKEFGPWLTISDGEYGLPTGTRIITVFSAGTHALTIAKVGSDYKIIDARFGSPD